MIRWCLLWIGDLLWGSELIIVGIIGLFSEITEQKSKKVVNYPFLFCATYYKNTNWNNWVFTKANSYKKIITIELKMY